MLPTTRIKVPLLDLREQNEALLPDLEIAFRRVVGSGHFILGSEVTAFESLAADLIHARHAVGVSSGTDAILLALMALEIGPGDEVICPSYTFFATGGCIARVGATPVFADSCPGCFNLDVHDAANRVTRRTKAILPVHLFGQSADSEAVKALADAYRLHVVEDAAQAFGGQFRASGSEFQTFSFFPSKNFGGFGDSGLLTTDDERLVAQARLLRNHGAERQYFHKAIGGNFRIDALQAALLAVKLPYLADYSNRRAQNAAYYSEGLSVLPGIAAGPVCTCRAKAKNDDNNGNILLPAKAQWGWHIWNQYTLRVSSTAQWKLKGNPRDALREFLSERDVASAVYYPVPLHRQECFATNAAANTSLPVSEKLAEECLSLPVFPELTREQADAVVGAIAEFLEMYAL